MEGSLSRSRYITASADGQGQNTAGQESRTQRCRTIRKGAESIWISRTRSADMKTEDRISRISEQDAA